MSLVGTSVPESCLHRAWDPTHEDSQLRTRLKQASVFGFSATFNFFEFAKFNISKSFKPRFYHAVSRKEGTTYLGVGRTQSGVQYHSEVPLDI